MPRLKNSARSQAFKRRMAMWRALGLHSQKRGPASSTRRGTGYRNRGKKWPVSLLTGCSHKLVIPPDKKFVLLVGDSHLRSLIDGFVQLPAGDLSCAVMCTQGAAAADLRTEVANAVLPWKPDAVCLLAPSNNLTTSGTVQEASADFRELLASVCSLHDNVVVLDFPPRLNVDVELQQHFHQEYHRVAAHMGVKYVSTVEYFPRNNLDLWAKDGVHLSDTAGMPILVQLLWFASCMVLQLPAPKPLTPARSSQDEVSRPSPPIQTLERSHVGQKRNQPEGLQQSSGAFDKKRLVQLKDCSIPISPGRFDVLLDEVEDVPTSLPDCPPSSTVVPNCRKTSPSVEQDCSTESGSRTAKMLVTQEVDAAELLVDASSEQLADAMLSNVHKASIKDTSESLPKPCVSIKKEPSPLVCGRHVRNATLPHDVNALTACSVVAAIKHVIAPVCTWQRADIDDVCVKGSVSSITVEASQGEERCSVMVPESSADTEVAAEDGSLWSCEDVVRSVRGSSHQGDAPLQNGDIQRVARSLAAVAKHTTDSVFSWQSDTVDEVAIAGDKLCTFLRESEATTGERGFLSVPQLPIHCVFDGHWFGFEYGNYVTGDVDVVDGEVSLAQALTSLWSVLEHMFSEYATCFLTLQNTTCAIICEDGRYAVFDSHSRSADGTVAADGWSAVVYYNSLDHVHEHICILARTLGNSSKQFEITGVRCINKGPVVNNDWSNVSSPSGDTVKSDVDGSQECAGIPLFNPLCHEVAQALCSHLNLESQKVEVEHDEVGELGSPCHKHRIDADGNSFFKAVSQAVSGTQKNHLKLRLAVVKLLETNAAGYETLLRSEFSSMTEYLRVSKMRYVGSGATDVEIQATADYLGVNIFTYCHDRWIEYSCNHTLLTDRGVYLENCNGSHYETVVCVQRPQLQGCYGYCQVSLGSKVYRLRQRSKGNRSVAGIDSLGCNASSVASPAHKRLCLSKYLKKNRTFQQKRKPQNDVSLREKQRERGRRRYAEDELYRNKIKERNFCLYWGNAEYREKAKARSIEKYRLDVLHRERVKQRSKMKRLEKKLQRQTVKAVSTAVIHGNQCVEGDGELTG